VGASRAVRRLDLGDHSVTLHHVAIIESVKKVIGTPGELPFSAGLEVDGWVYLSGQGGFHPGTGELGDTIEEQTNATIDNVASLLGEAGLGLGDVVSCLVHLTDLDEFAAFNAVYASRFPDPKPVRTTVRADLVRGMHVEITVVARRP
jgi:2-iminobutanoate/2-iminopropanoate deaminase